MIAHRPITNALGPAGDDTPTGNPYQGVGPAVRGILHSKDEQDKFEHLHRRAQEHLKVFDLPHCAHLDTPAWVMRLWPDRKRAAYRDQVKFTVRKVVKAMYDTAEDLGLDSPRFVGGRRYVAAAICACASGDNNVAESTGSSEEEKEVVIAKRLQCLASTWAAFLLWPFYAHGWQGKRVRVPYPETPHWASITPSFFFQKAPAPGEPDKRLPERQATPQDKILLRDSYRCVLSGFVDRMHYQRLLWDGCTDLPQGRQDDLKAVNLFKRSLAAYSGASGSGYGGRDEFDSTLVTLEILLFYCGLDPEKYILDTALMDSPKNTITLTTHFQRRFDYLTMCLKPTETPHCYDVIDYEPPFNHLDIYSVPAQITLKDRSSEVPRPTPGGHRTHEDVPNAEELELPDPELVRLHAALAGVLHFSGAYESFDAFFQPLAHSGRSAYPSWSGGAFWRSVVEYEGPASCAEVELREAATELRRAVNRDLCAERARESRSIA